MARSEQRAACIHANAHHAPRAGPSRPSRPGGRGIQCTMWKKEDAWRIGDI
ncbi:MAG: hypothetical protein ABGY24_18150 [bacterium]